MTIFEKNHPSKKHRYTTPLIYMSTVSYNQYERQLPSTTSIDK
jgi:hypothetical protein